MAKTTKKKYVNVKEFAEMAGVSSQAIYKQLNGKLQTYSTKVGNQRKIDISALWEVYGLEDFQPIQPKLQTNSTSEMDSVYLKMIQILEDQLKEKDKQIAALQKQLDQEQQLRMVDKQKALTIDEQVQETEKKVWWKFWK